MDRYNAKTAIGVANRLLAFVVALLLPLILLSFMGCASVSPIPKIEYTPVFKDGEVSKEWRCREGESYTKDNQCLQDCTHEFNLLLSVDPLPYLKCVDNQKSFYKNHIKRYESKIELNNRQIGEMK